MPLLLLGGLLGTSCGVSQDVTCTPGRSIGCIGDMNCTGFQSCRADGSGYEPCTCASGGDSSVDTGTNDAEFDSGDTSTPDSAVVDSGADITVPADAANDSGITSSWAFQPADVLNGIGVDASKNVYIAGAFGGNQVFFAQKRDSAGNVKWTVTGSGASQKWHGAYAIAVDPGSGNNYYVGYSEEAFDIGGTQFAAGGYIVKLDSSGALVWRHDGLNAHLWDVALKAGGTRVVACGQIDGGTSFGGGYITPNGGPDAVVQEWGQNGPWTQGRQFGPNVPSLQTVWSCAVDGNDNVVFGGGFESSIDLGGGALTGPAPNSGALNLYLGKLDFSLSFVAQRDLKVNSGKARLGKIGFDTSNNVFVSGPFDVSIDFGGGVLSTAGLEDVFLSKLSTSLGHVWSKRYGDSKSQRSGGVSFANNDVVVWGGYDGLLDFGCGALPQSAGYGLFLVRLDGNGSCASQYGSSTANATATLSAASFLEQPDWAVAGAFTSSVKLPSGILSGTPTGFVARLHP